MSELCGQTELYHHRGLDEALRSAFEAHLERCASCRAELEELREVDGLLRDALSRGVDEAVRHSMTGRIRRRLDAAPRRRRWAVAGLVAAAAAAAAFVLLATRPDPRPAPAPSVAETPPPIPAAPAPPAPPPAPAVVKSPAPAPVVPPAPPPPAPAVEEELPVHVVTRAPAPVRPAPAARTVTGRARVERTKGEVTVAGKAAADGQDLLADEELVVPPDASAVLVHADGTRIDLAAGSRLSYPMASAGPMLFEGRIAVDAADVEPHVFATRHAEVRARAARFTLGTDEGSTRVEVTGGRADFLNRLDGRSWEVGTGRHAFAFAAASVDPRRVDQAIRKGIEYLRTADSPAGPYGVKSSDELILLTMIHAGLPEGDPDFQALLKKVLEAPLETTYNVALQAMALEELHRVKYQPRIAQCAQFLIDNQCRNGQWSYGKPSAAALNLDVPTTGGSRPEAATGGRGVLEFGTEKAKPKVTRKLAVRKTREGIDAGDNSNAQYAALGIRACHDAGIVFPREALVLARKYWVESAIGDAKTDAVATGGKMLGVPQGWCYKGYHHQLKYCRTPDNAYTSMTAGAVGAVAIYDSVLGIDWKKDKTVHNGLAWLVKNWSWSENAGPCEIAQSAPKAWLYYGFYAIERAGMLCDIEKIGPYDWYREGATVILDAQKSNGSWAASDGSASKIQTWDTCFAILFLKRATRPLDVASEDKRR